MKRLLSQSRTNQLPTIGLGLAYVVVVLVVARNCGANHFRQLYYGNQLIFEQAMYHVVRGEGLYAPLESFYVGYEIASHNASHFQPVLYPLALLWWLVPSSVLLLALNAALVYAGCFLVAAIAERLLRSPWLGCGAGGVFLLDWTLMYQLQLEFFPLNWVVPCYLLVLYGLVSERPNLVILGAIGALLLKETEGFTVLFLGGMVALWAPRWREIGKVLSLIGLLWLLLVFGWVFPSFSAGQGYAFDTLYTGAPLHERLLDWRNVDLFQGNLVRLAYLPLLAPLAWIPTIPTWGALFLSGLDIHKTVGSHQSMPIQPFLYFGVFLTIARIRRHPRGRMFPIFAVGLLLGLNGVLLAVSGAVTMDEAVYPVYRPAADDPLWRNLEVIPEDAVISADLMSMPALKEEHPALRHFPRLYPETTWVVAQVRPEDIPWVKAGLLQALGAGFLPQTDSWREGFWVLGRDTTTAPAQALLGALASQRSLQEGDAPADLDLLQLGTGLYPRTTQGSWASPQVTLPFAARQECGAVISIRGILPASLVPTNQVRGTVNGIPSGMVPVQTGRSTVTFRVPSTTVRDGVNLLALEFGASFDAGAAGLGGAGQQWSWLIERIAIEPLVPCGEEATGDAPLQP